jgi:hypothetical protein
VAPALQEDTRRVVLRRALSAPLGSTQTPPVRPPAKRVVPVRTLRYRDPRRVQAAPLDSTPALWALHLALLASRGLSLLTLGRCFARTALLAAFRAPEPLCVAPALQEDTRRVVLRRALSAPLGSTQTPLVRPPAKYVVPVRTLRYRDPRRVQAAPLVSTRALGLRPAQHVLRDPSPGALD